MLKVGIRYPITAVTIANRRVPFPPENYYAIYGSVFNRDPHHLSLFLHC